MIACTVTGNSDFGLANYGNGSTNGSIALTDTIVAGNQLNGTPTDIGGTDPAGVTGSNNLVGTGGSGGLVATNNLLNVAAPGLGVLGSYGGSTQTVALLPGSPAIGAGVAVTGVTTDQRGDPLDSPNPDIGAFQTGGFTITAVAGSTPQSAVPGRGLCQSLGRQRHRQPVRRSGRRGLVSFSAPTSGLGQSFQYLRDHRLRRNGPGGCNGQFQQRLLFGCGDDHRCRRAGRVRAHEPDPTALLRFD